MSGAAGDGRTEVYDLGPRLTSPLDIATSHVYAAGASIPAQRFIVPSSSRPQALR